MLLLINAIFSQCFVVTAAAKGIQDISQYGLKS